MKRFLLFMVLSMPVLFYSQTTLFSDDFESYTDFEYTTIGNWTLVDVDMLNTYGFQGVTFTGSGVPKSFQVFNSTATTPPLTPSAVSNWAGYNSVKGAVCFAAVPTATSFNNDWIITPAITLGASGNSFSFWYKACSADWSQEKFKVGIGTSSDYSTFTIVSANPESIASGDISWHQFTYTIPSSYDGQTVYIGINCVSQDQFGFMIDDFSVVTTNMGVEDVSSETSNFYITPNPVKEDFSIQISPDFNKESISVTVSDVSGKQVAAYNSFMESYNVSSLSKGVYLVTITDGNKTKTQKLIKK